MASEAYATEQWEMERNWKENCEAKAIDAWGHGYHEARGSCSHGSGEGMSSPQCCRKKPLNAVQALLLHRLASSDESSLLEHLLRFFRAFFSPVLLEKVDECLRGGGIGWNLAHFSTEGLIQPMKDDRMGIAQAPHLTMTRSPFTSLKQVD